MTALQQAGSLSETAMHGVGWHGIRTEVTLNEPIETVFEFFADAHNLEKITPPGLRFKITDEGKVDVNEGALINYRLQLFGIPFKWKTRISQWRPPLQFVDEQLKGPYKTWHHTHSFDTIPDGKTFMRDVVRYRLPFFPFGEVALPVVAAQVKRIFDFRNRTIVDIFGGHIH